MKIRIVVICGLLATCNWVAAAAAGEPRPSTTPASASAPASAPSANDESAVEALAKAFESRLARSRYMQAGEGREVKVAGWEPFPTRRYTYSVTDKDGTTKSADVVMLNP